jgi:hypothetical protein
VKSRIESKWKVESSCASKCEKSEAEPLKNDADPKHWPNNLNLP